MERPEPQARTSARQEPACAKRILTNLAHHAFRRPVVDADVQPLVRLYDKGRAEGGDFDEGIRRDTTLEKLAELKPVFRENGTVTAGNACPLNDGAAAVVVMSDTRARELGITPLARIVSTGLTSLEPEFMGLGPIEASRQALQRAGMTIADVQVVEINEAFAAQIVPCKEDLGIEDEKLNPFGGAIALGHPFGMTGARIMTTLLNALDDDDKTWGLESMCVGGGQGMAMVVERLS